MVMVSVSETYDLHTDVNKMTLIGIHTPTKDLIQKTYPGLCMNSKFFRIDHVDVMLSTAQTLPLGVDQIGLDAGKIHPQDMMNPILYKATSNDSWSNLECRLQGYVNQSTGGVDNVHVELNGSMAFTDKDNVTGLDDEHGVYYSLLSNRDGFRIAHPQSGVEMKGLIPLVFDKWYSHGENSMINRSQESVEDSGFVIQQDSNGNYQRSALRAVGMRGRPHPMPKMNTTYLTGLATTGSSTPGTHTQYNGMGDGGPANCQIQMPDVPPVMLGAIILPPVSATTGILYYRMVCRAFIEFTEVRPIQEITAFSQLDSAYSPLVYHTDYNEQSKSMDQTTDMVDIKNGNIEKIMEGR